MQIGSLVTIGEPFNSVFPDTYPVIHLFGDGSAAVMIPGWIQEGETFSPAQGANFSGSYLVDTGTTVDLTTLDIPKSIPEPLPAPTTFDVISTSTPALNGSYLIDMVTQQNVGAVSIYTAINNRFPASQAELPWPDKDGTYHMFPSVALWQAFATAMADFVMRINLGQTPSNPVTII